MIQIITLFISIFTANTLTAQESKTVLISQVVEHPALSKTTKGIIDGLSKNGFKRGANLNVRVESAQGSPTLAAQIASKFANQKPDIVVGLGTISAQSFIRYAKNGQVKLIFSSITDHLNAKLKPDSNISGVSNFVDLTPQIKIFKKLQPRLNIIGILYNQGEPNSVSIVNKLEKICTTLNLILIKQTIKNSSEVAQAVTKLAGQVDAIFISNDNTALSALSSIIKTATQAKIPVYVSDTDAVELGALAALGPNQYEIGLQTGEMIAQVLKGKDLKSIDVQFPQKTELYINLDTAKTIGINIPKDINATNTKFIQKVKS